MKDAYLGCKSVFLKKAKKGLSEKAEHLLFMGKGMGEHHVGGSQNEFFKLL